MPDGEDDALREAAAHRGLKLVKSRKRKAGVGDHGRFGLTDASGKELFGFGPDGLTALPADIRDYLRTSEISTWAQSAEATPDRAKPARSNATPVAAANDTEMPEDQPAPPASEGESRRRRAPAATGSHRKEAPRLSKRKVASDAESAPAKPEPERKPPPKPRVQPLPKLAPVLSIRSAAKADLVEIRRLVGVRMPAAVFALRFNELKRAGGGVIVADRARVIGCVAWHVILGLQEAPIGRLTLLVVTEDNRRQGIGRALVDAARSAMVDQGCTTIEAMSDIEVRNANGFYRALGLAQKSHRFVSDAGSKG